MDCVALHTVFFSAPHRHCRFGIAVMFVYWFAAHPQPAADRLPGRDVKVAAHAAHAPPAP